MRFGTMRKLAISVAAGVLACVAGTASAQTTLPLWELGLVVGAGYLPDYPAADEYSTRVLPLPYFVYRGKVFRSEESGLLRGRVFDSASVQFDISVAGALDVKSKNNVARAGMPDLDYMGQIGPRLQVVLGRSPNGAAHVDLEIPARAVLSTDFSSIDYVGLLSVPEIAYQHDNFLGRGNRLKLDLGFTFADQKYQDVIYGVPAAFATGTRPTYEAKGGYMGAKVSLGVLVPVGPTLRLVGQVRGDYYGGAANEDSPLFRSKSSGQVLVGAILSFWRSRSTVVE